MAAVANVRGVLLDQPVRGGEGDGGFLAGGSAGRAQRQAPESDTGETDDAHRQIVGLSCARLAPTAMGTSRICRIGDHSASNVMRG
jgi:hypothetical protein